MSSSHRGMMAKRHPKLQAQCYRSSGPTRRIHFRSGRRESVSQRIPAGLCFTQVLHKLRESTHGDLCSYRFQYLMQGLSDTGKHRCVTQGVGTGLCFTQVLHKVKEVAYTIRLECHDELLVIQAEGIG